MNADDKLRVILRAEADEIDPSAEGWNRIRDGIAARRRRTAWLRGSVAAATVMSVAALATIVVRPNDDPSVIGNDPAASSSATPEPSPTRATLAPLLDAVWPFTDLAEVDAWIERGVEDELATAAGAARAFAEVYVDLDNAEVAVVTQGTTEQRLAVRRPIEGGGQSIEVTTLRVRRFDRDGRTGPWVVVSAESPRVSVDQPAPGDVVTSPLSASGHYRDVDPSYVVQLRRAPKGLSDPAGEITRALARTGPDGWSASLEFPTPPGERAAAVVVSSASPADGRLGTFVVRPVRFATSTEPSPTSSPGETPAGQPSTLVAVVDGRVAVLDSATGKLVRYLTERAPGAVQDVSLSPDGQTAYYSQAAGTCASGNWSVPVSGGAPTQVADAGEGAAMAPTMNDDGALAYLTVDCRDGGTDMRLKVVDAHGSEYDVDVPDDTRGPLAWVAGGRVAFVNGMTPATNSLTVVDPFNPSDKDEHRASAGCFFSAVTARPTGGIDELLAAQVCQPGDDGKRSTILTAMSVTGREAKSVLVLDGIEVIALDYDRAGKYLLISQAGAEAAGPLYTWNGSNDPVRVTDGPQTPAWS